ncbi:hypothetical protein [Lentzea sp. NPDC060358]|uniref:hypothetical protein n=1 Tax=Lentzea sp. NPDC060358 TaxID=3347103 RepID=UPI003663440A
MLDFATGVESCVEVADKLWKLIADFGEAAGALRIEQHTDTNLQQIGRHHLTTRLPHARREQRQAHGAQRAVLLQLTSERDGGPGDLAGRNLQGVGQGDD